MDDIWIISWFNHTAFDANPIWKSPNEAYAGPNSSCISTRKIRTKSLLAVRACLHPKCPWLLLPVRAMLLQVHPNPTHQGLNRNSPPHC